MYDHLLLEGYSDQSIIRKDVIRFMSLLNYYIKYI